MRCMQGSLFHDDEADDHLNQQYTEQSSFGGGLLEKKKNSTDPDDEPDRHRSKKEVTSHCLCQPLVAALTTQLARELRCHRSENKQSVGCCFSFINNKNWSIKL